MSSILKVLKNKNFLFLWIGQLISQFGDCLVSMALISLVYDKFSASTIAYAKLIFFIVIPVFLIGPIAGILVDRWNRKKVMITCDVLRAVLVSLIPILFTLNKNMIFVYICVFLVYSSTRFFLPSKLSIIPDLVSEDKLLAANSLTTTSRTIALIFSVALAGVTVQVLGWKASFYIDGLTYIVSAILISRIDLPQVAKEIKHDVSVARDVIRESFRRGLMSDIRQGRQFILHDPQMRFISVIFFLLMSGVGAISVVLIVFVQGNFGTATSHLSFLTAFLAMGFILGTLLYAKLGQNVSKERAIYISFVLSGATLALFSKVITPHTPIYKAGFMAFVWGIVLSPIMVCLYTLLHEKVPNKLRGKTFSAIEIFIHAGFLLFMFLCAWLADKLTPAEIIMYIGIVFVALGLFNLRRMPIDKTATTC
jgi:MFS family permease